MREIQIVILVGVIAILSTLVRPATVASFLDIERRIADENLQAEIVKAQLTKAKLEGQYEAVRDDTSSTN